MDFWGHTSHVSEEEPVRAFMDEEGVHWRFGAPPDYTLANLMRPGCSFSYYGADRSPLFRIAYYNTYRMACRKVKHDRRYWG